MNQIQEIILLEGKISESGSSIQAPILKSAKSMGFSDEKLADLTSTSLKYIQEKRKEYDINPVFKRIDTCGGEFRSEASYLYSTYDTSAIVSKNCESEPSSRQKVLILGLR